MHERRNEDSIWLHTLYSKREINPLTTQRINSSTIYNIWFNDYR